jgi:hypothetical protein
MMLKSNAPVRPTTLVRLTVGVVGMTLLVFTWFQLMQWAGAE